MHSHEGKSEAAKEVWTDGTPPPAGLGSISVFDAKNARLYVDAENKVGFLPREVGLLEQHAANCTAMDAKFEAEVKQLNQRIKVPLPTGYSPDGTVAKLFARLVPKGKLPAEDEIRAAAAWTKKDGDELEALEKLLALDPKVIAERCRRAASILKAYAADAVAIETGLSKESEARLAQLVGQSKSAIATAALAAAERFEE